MNNITSIQPHFSIGDDLKSTPASQCQLYLLYAPSSMSIMSYHTENNSIIHLRKYSIDENAVHQSLESIFSIDELLQFHYLNYRLSIFSPTTYLVSNYENQILENKFDKSAIPSLNASIYYQINSEMRSFFDKKPAYQLSSSSASLIETLIKKQQIQKTKIVYAHYFDRYLELLAFDGSQLLLHNIFPIEQEADFSYYILSTYELFGFSTSLVSTIILGTITKPSKVYDMLFTYVKDVQFMKKNAIINYTKAFDDIEDHIIYPLTSIIKQ
jgi:hypothetical protein